MTTGRHAERSQESSYPPFQRRLEQRHHARLCPFSELQHQVTRSVLQHHAHSISLPRSNGSMTIFTQLQLYQVQHKVVLRHQVTLGAHRGSREAPLRTRLPTTCLTKWTAVHGFRVLNFLLSLKFESSWPKCSWRVAKVILESPSSPVCHTKDLPTLIVTKHIHGMIDVLKVPAIQSAAPSFNLVLEWRPVPPFPAPLFQREHGQLRDSPRHLLSSVFKTDQLHPLRPFLRRNETACSGLTVSFPKCFMHSPSKFQSRGFITRTASCTLLVCQHRFP